MALPDVSGLQKTLALLNTIVKMGTPLAKRAIEAISELAALNGLSKEELLAIADAYDADFDVTKAELEARAADDVLH